MTQSFDHALSERIKSALDVRHDPDWRDVVSRTAAREPARRRRRPRRLVVVVGFASCLLALSLGLALHGGGATGVGTAHAECTKAGASAASCLRALASVAKRGSAPPAIAHQRVSSYRVITVVPKGSHAKPWEVRLTSAKSAFTVYAVQTTETWIERSTGHGAQRIEESRLEFPTARDQAAWKAAGSPTLKRLGGSQPSSFKRIAGNASDLFFFHPAAWILATHARDQEQALPTTADAMVGLLKTVASFDGASSDWAAYADLPLTDPSLLPAQRAALLGAVARAPYAKLMGHMRDPLGRDGIAISNLYDQAKGPRGVQWVYLYDPRTSRLLAEGAWPGGVSPRRAGWRSSFGYSVFAISGAAASRLPGS